MSILINTSDDMKWLRDVHLPRLSKSYRSAVIHGNEDYPSRIEVYLAKNPTIDDKPVVYTPDADGKYRRLSDGALGDLAAPSGVIVRRRKIAPATAPDDVDDNIGNRQPVVLDVPDDIGNRQPPEPAELDDTLGNRAFAFEARPAAEPQAPIQGREEYIWAWLAARRDSIELFVIDEGKRRLTVHFRGSLLHRGTVLEVWRGAAVGLVNLLIKQKELHGLRVVFIREDGLEIKNKINDGYWWDDFKRGLRNKGRKANLAQRRKARKEERAQQAEQRKIARAWDLKARGG